MFRYPEFPIESHEVQTEDGYILTLQRVRYQKPTKEEQNESKLEEKKQEIEEDEDEDYEIKETYSKKKMPCILLVHGFVCSADQWCLNTPDKALPYELAQEGFDCWLANLRGTPLSKGHISLSNSSAKYWDFSFHEMALFDIPCMVNYILEVNGSASLYYIGHSMGCTVYFASIALLPELNSKIRQMIALAPAMYGKHIPSTLIRLGIPLATFFGNYKSIYRKPTMQLTSQGLGKKICLPFCNPEKAGNWVLRRIASFGGFGKFGEQIEKDRISKIAATYPASTSVKVFTHGNKCFSSDKLQYYDYGRSGNMKRYGKYEAPMYDLKNVTAPVSIFYSDHDKLCSPRDIQRLADELQNLSSFVRISDEHFNHMDFLLGKDANTLVHQKVIRILKSSL